MNSNKIIVKRKSEMTLIEVLIALFITSLLLSLLMYFYRDLDKFNQASENLQREAFKISYIENRLADILPKAISPRDSKGDFYFFTSLNANGLLVNGFLSLVFTFDNGVILDKPFSNHVLGRLYVDGDQQLWLAIWPSPKRWDQTTPQHIPIKKELLLDHVEKIHFEFFVAPERNRSRIITSPNMNHKRVEIYPKDCWLQEWKYEYQQLPAIVKINIVRRIGSDLELITFSFPLPNSEMVIVYDR